MYIWCEHCNKMIWAERTTKRFCSATCRVAHNRGQQPPQRNSTTEQLTEVANMLALHHPHAYEHLKRIQDYHGQKPTNLALMAILEVLRDD